MNADLIDIEFRKAILTSGAYRQMKISHQHQKLLRNHLKRGINISLDKKIKLLQRMGWRSDQFLFTRTDLMLFGQFILKQREGAISLGIGYMVEKFLNTPATGASKGKKAAAGQSPVLSPPN